MLDIWQIRKHPEQVQENFNRRGFQTSVADILELDEKKRELQTNLQDLRHKKRVLSEKIACRKKNGLPADDLLGVVRGIKNKLDAMEGLLRLKMEQLQEILISLPNLLDDEVGDGDEVLDEFGEKQVFDFQPLGHMELCRRHCLVDYGTAGQLMGSGYWIYRGLGARLEWALLNFCIQENQAAGYELILPPPLAREECGFGAGQFPRFRDDVYWIGGTEQFLIPTAETVLVNLHRNQVLDGCRLPLKYTAFSSCFRRETGRRLEDKGMARGHHFHKVELVQFAAGTEGRKAFSQILAQARNLLEQLGLHYRVVRLGAGGCGTASSKTYDLEVWLPAERTYTEVSSVSDMGDYQARRTGTRFRDSRGKLCYVHTLNGSGLATSRLFAAIMEQGQRPDGNVRIPEALVPWVGTDVFSQEEVLPCNPYVLKKF